MTDSRVILAFLHSLVNPRTLRKITKPLRRIDCADIREVPDIVKPNLSSEECTEIETAIAKPDDLEDLDRQLREAKVMVVARGDDQYPSYLEKSLQDSKSEPPPLLYVKGDICIIQEPGIGICGSRKASPAGLEHAEAFGRTIANEGITEVSGYARGVDERSHFGALKAGGKSIAVLAEGILRFRYRKAFRDLPDIENRMVVVSEFHPKRPWHVSTAMTRNDTILGLSMALVAVEASEKGGTMNAGRRCLKRKKPLWVLQYEQASAQPEGNTKLIELGGKRVKTNNQLRRLIQRVVRDPAATTSQIALQTSLAI